MTICTDNPAHVGMHVFERAGLGRAPFRCVGYTEKVFTNPDGTTRAGGSCQYCGTGIRYACSIKSSDGREFVVGSDCVAKTDDAGLIRSYKIHPAVRAARRAKTKDKDNAISAEWNALIAQNADLLASIQVPGRPWVPGEMITKLDDLRRVWKMCGASGRARHLRALKTFLQSPVAA